MTDVATPPDAAYTWLNARWSRTRVSDPRACTSVCVRARVRVYRCVRECTCGIRVARKLQGHTGQD